MQNPHFRPIYRPCFTPPTVPLRAPHWYEVSIQDISKSAPAKRDDLSIDVSPKNIIGPIETGEDAVSLTEVLSQSRRLRRWEENLHYANTQKKNSGAVEEATVSFHAAGPDEEDDTTSVSISIVNPSVKPKGKNPFKHDE